MKNLRLSSNIFTLFAAMIFGNASERIIFPLFALVFFDVHSQLLASDAPPAIRSYWYGICMATPSIATFIATPLLSCLSDYFGRKNILILCFCGTTVAGFITGIAIVISSLPLFMLGIFIQGLFCRTNPIAQAAIGETALGSNKLLTMGYLQSTIAFGAFLGPIIGGYCAYLYFKQLNFSAAFFLSMMLSAIALGICFFFFKETLANKKKRVSLRLMLGSLALLKERQTFYLAAILACGQITWSFYYQYVPATIKVLTHFSAGKLGIFVGLMALWVTIGSSLGITLLRSRFSLFSCLRIALSLQCLGSILIVIAFYLHCSWLIFLSSIPAAIGDVITFGVLSTVYSNRYPQQQGQAMGACYFNAALMWMISGLLGGYLMAVYYLLPLILMPFGVILALCVTQKPNARALFN